MKRAALVLVLAAVVLVWWAAPAGANEATDKATCRAAPNPATPDGGMMGFLVQPPANPWNGDPFAPNADHAISDKYGYGGLGFVTYDQGCPGQIQSYAPNLMENLVWRAPVYMTALAGQVMATMMHPTFLGVFDPLMVNTAKAVHDGPFALLVPVTVAGVGLYVLWLAFGHTVSVSHALSSGLWMLFVIGIASFFASQPLWAVRTFDDNTLMVTEAVGSGFGGSDALVGSIHKNILYKQWLRGTFGDPDGAAAKRYGAELFDAGAYTWAEWKSVESGQVNAADLKKSKQQHWQDVADKIEHEYPVAYEHLQGQHIPDRFGMSLLSIVGVAGATLFQVIAGMAFVVALVTVRLFVLVWPVAVILGAFPTKRHVLLRLWEMLLGSLVAAVACQVAAGLVSLAVGSILASTELAGWLVIFLMLAVFIAAWRLLRPYRSFAGGHVGNASKKAAKAILAIKVGEEMVEHGVKDANKKRTTGREPPPVPQNRGRRTEPPPPPPSSRREPPTDMGAGFVRERETGTPQLGAYRPMVEGPKQGALGRGASRAWEDGGPRVRVEDSPPADVRGPRVRVDATARSAPNPPDGSSRAARPSSATVAEKPPIDTRAVQGKDEHKVYVPVQRRAKEKA